MDEKQAQTNTDTSLPKDFSASIVVFLVALPLCLGIALASGAPLFSGLLAGIVGGIVVGSLSGSHTSVSGPAAGLTAVVAAQLANLGSFEAFLLAVVVGGVIQIGLGIAKAGALSAFFPSSVIKGLLAAIGVILILKQIPHLLGHDNDPDGEMSFSQPDQKNTFSEILTLFDGEIHLGAAVIGLITFMCMMLWANAKPLKKSGVPGPLAVVLIGVGLQLLFSTWGGRWLIGQTHLVQIPIAESFSDFSGFLSRPDFSQWSNPAVYIGGLTIAIVASLETLLNLEATDKLDPRRRNSPASRELWAQGAGNVAAGLIGGIPVTSVIVRSSVNVDSGATSKRSAVMHGFLLLLCVGLFPRYLNMIPLSALAAILIYTGFKLASPALFKQMWKQGRYQFIPFIVTVLAIVFSDLLIGILIGLVVSILFILNSMLRYPIRQIVETHVTGEVVRIELANQVSFLKRAALDTVLNDALPGTTFLIDATESDYIDPDVLGLIREFKETIGPARGHSVSLQGFRDKYDMNDEVLFADYSTRELQDRLTPIQVLGILEEGNQRFVKGERLTRDFNRQINAAAKEQSPLAVVLSCVDSQVPTELVFDLGIGDISSVRVAGNVIGTKSLGSIEYAVNVAGAKLVLVLGNTQSEVVSSSVKLIGATQSVEQASGCPNLQAIVSEIQQSADTEQWKTLNATQPGNLDEKIDEVAKKNVERTVREIISRSHVIRAAVDRQQLLILGAMYDVKTGMIDFFR
jgi:carbonic anhydrase/SulP family sulfate permease